MSRLKLFLQQSGIANSQFADNCEIPRPTLSQLLNGRNKKVSDEVIAKIHRAYPHLNIMWLMFGDGEMFVPNAKSGDAVQFAQPLENGSAGSAPAGVQGAKKSTTISFGDDSAPFAAQQSPRGGATATAMADALQHMARMNQPPRGARQTGGSAPAQDERSVVSIMVLYSDGRFETFTPQ